jgi:fructokinase
MPPARVLLVGEVLWDLFPGGAQLGGAPLNVGAHLARLGHAARLVSAVGADALGEKARCAIASLGVDTTLLQSTTRFATGTATVTVSPEGETSFSIGRPAAYDAVAIAGDTLRG